MKLPTHLSYNAVNTFLLCPKSFWYRYFEKVEAPRSPALIFGSAFHNAVEAHLLEKDKDCVPLQLRWDRHWQNELRTTEGKEANIAWDKPPSHYEGMGAKLLSNYNVVRVIDKIRPETRDMRMSIELKVKFRVPHVPVPIIGYIDIIEEDGIPGDLKTSSRPWSQRRADSELQADFYLAALAQMGRTVDKFRYYVFVKSPPQAQVFTTHRTLRDRERMFGIVQKTWDAIERGEFPTNTKVWKCNPRWCDYYETCQGNRKIRRV